MSGEGWSREGGEGQPPRSPVKIPWRLLGGLALLALVVVFALQNTQDVDVDFLWMQFALPLIVVVAGTAAVAIIAGDIIGWAWRRRKRQSPAQ